MHNSIKTVSPVDGSVFVERDFASTHQIQQALLKSNEAQLVWGKMDITERQDICRKAVDLINLEKDDAAKEICWQMGSSNQICSW